MNICHVFESLEQNDDNKNDTNNNTDNSVILLIVQKSQGQPPGMYKTL